MTTKTEEEEVGGVYCDKPDGPLEDLSSMFPAYRAEGWTVTTWGHPATKTLYLRLRWRKQECWVRLTKNTVKQALAPVLTKLDEKE
jgi:hypothetical protein